MAKIQEMATVLEQTILAESVYSMWLAPMLQRSGSGTVRIPLLWGRKPPLTETNQHLSD